MLKDDMVHRGLTACSKNQPLGAYKYVPPLFAIIVYFMEVCNINFCLVIEKLNIHLKTIYLLGHFPGVQLLDKTSLLC